MAKASESAGKLPRRISCVGLARLFGISTQRIGQLNDQGAVRRLDRNEYALETSIKLYVGHLRKVASSGGADAALSSERVRLTRAKANAAEAEQKILAGELVPASDVLAAWEVLVERSRTRLLAIPSMVGGRLGPQAAELVRKMLYETLDEISKTKAPKIRVDRTHSGKRRQSNGNGIEARP